MELSHISTKPGVYIYRNKQRKVIYVGKAVNLKNRVSSYFQSGNAFSKQKLLVAEIANIETIEVENELEALLLEANLIKKYNPHYNIRLKDDKDYLYIKISNDPYPSVITARRKDLDTAKIYFGPFPNSTLVRKTLKSLRRVFKFCGNPPNEIELKQKKARLSAPETSDASKILFAKRKPCFWFHIGQCTGVCVGSIDKRQYTNQIRALATFLEGKKTKLVDDLTKEMTRQASRHQYESAAKIRDQIQGIQYITQNTNIKGYIDNPEYRKTKREEEVTRLQEVLGLAEFPTRIECYDISHHGGKNTTASMVVLMEGEPVTSLYRHYKIKSHDRNDDFASMREVIERRLKRLEKSDGDASFGQRPDLIIIDGGKGQLSAALSVEEEKKSGIPFVSLAKKEEIIYTPTNQDGIRLPKTDPASLVVQRVRDEAHRFALRLHRNLKGKSLLNTLKGNKVLSTNDL